MDRYRAELHRVGGTYPRSGNGDLPDTTCLVGSGRENDRSERCSSPELHRTLAALGLDVQFDRADGAYLYHTSSGSERRVIDFVAGFGATLLGHHAEAVTTALRSFLDSQEPVFCQGSRQEATERLARKLSERCGGDYIVRFGSTGAEAVEIAIKHARLESGCRRIVVLERAFHGKTIGTLPLGRHASEHVAGTAATEGEVIRIPWDNPDAIRSTLLHEPDVAACLFEPILGEGGVRPLPDAVLQELADVCLEAGVPLIADEIQTGLGRTGRFLASEAAGVQPDYVVLSKALGGGVAKISACLIRRSRYQPSFDWMHSSTYSGDPLSSTVALAVLDQLTDEKMAAARQTGAEVLLQLQGLQEQFPDVIADTRGAGLMIGLEFRPQLEAASFLARTFSSSELLTHVVAAYLFHQHAVRAIPSLSDPWTLRFHGTMVTSKEDWNQLLQGLEDVCLLLAQEETTELIRAAIPSGQGNMAAVGVGRDWVPFRTGLSVERKHSNRQTPRRVGWLCHLVDTADVAGNDLSFARLNERQREQLLKDMVPFVKPVVMNSVTISSQAGELVELIPMMLPASSQMFRQWSLTGNVDRAKALVEQGIAVAEKLGCELVSLGQYTSIVTRNGRSCAHASLGLTTGNAFAALLSRAAILRLLEDRYGAPSCAEALTFGVVGAAGNIGKLMASSLAEKFSRTLLFPSTHPRSKLRLKRVAASMPRAMVAEDLTAMQEVDVVLSSVSSPQPILGSHHLKTNAIVCDVSVPGSIAADVPARRPDVQLIRGGIVQLPNNESLGIASFPLPPGQTYACMAEGMLLGLEGRFDKYFTGALRMSHLQQIEIYAKRHGFGLAACKRESVHGDEIRVPAKPALTDHWEKDLT